ncbi:hypothetical protein B0T25DRAFT_292433 [Lasiosphaeria hispida]|uniref:Uncharacterized protein n=1 Tax=Lasiosphaeria hispida TaxID=260671 RepID=A0AAJ0HD12_9PEZI|nr:hypothetical protein B0T25DRAFT_292433 [Lasiosphaeria hispida]
MGGRGSSGLLATSSDLRLGGSQAILDDSTPQISSPSLYEPPSSRVADAKQPPIGDTAPDTTPRIVVSAESVDGRSESAGALNDSRSGNITPRTVSPGTSLPGSSSGSPWLQAVDAPHTGSVVGALDRGIERNARAVRKLLTHQQQYQQRSLNPEPKRPRDSSQDLGGQDAFEGKARDSSARREVFRLTTTLKEAIEMKTRLDGELQELRLLHDQDQGTIEKLRELYWDMSYDYRDLREDFEHLQAKFDTRIPMDDGSDSAAFSRLVQQTPKEVRQETKIHELTQELKRLKRQLEAREGA